jgi:hypothetical protein
LAPMRQRGPAQSCPILGQKFSVEITRAERLRAPLFFLPGDRLELELHHATVSQSARRQLFNSTTVARPRERQVCESIAQAQTSQMAPASISFSARAFFKASSLEEAPSFR